MFPIFAVDMFVSYTTVGVLARLWRMCVVMGVIMRMMVSFIANATVSGLFV